MDEKWSKLNLASNYTTNIVERNLPQMTTTTWFRRLASKYGNVENGERKTATGPRSREMSTEKRVPGVKDLQSASKRE